MIRRGDDGAALPCGEFVLRLALRPKDFDQTGKASPVAFELSSEDKRGNPPRLSVFCAALTSPFQAWTIAGEKPGHELALTLAVDDIRALRPDPGTPGAEMLDVVWHHISDTRPGAEGHAGITGLDKGTSLQRKSYRMKLADAAIAKVFRVSVQPGVENGRFP